MNIRKDLKKIKKDVKGITLIALVVTIIVLLILAGIALNLTIGQNGIFTRAQDAANTWRNAENNEQLAMNDLSSWIDENIPKGAEPIPETESYVGYYADTDGDNEADGIIYVDLADTENTSGRWNNDTEGWSDWEYTPVTEGLKQYEIISESYTGLGEQWTKPVLKKIDGSEGADRFYVMALEDINPGTYYCWYDAAYDNGGKLDKIIDFSTNDFGSGKENTAYVMDKWKNSSWGKQDDNGSYLDMWGVIEDEVAKGWFVPSKSEWAAFGTFAYDKLGVDTDNYPDYGLSDWYWSSAQYAPSLAYLARFRDGYIDRPNVYNNISVRLSTTF